MTWLVDRLWRQSLAGTRIAVAIILSLLAIHFFVFLHLVLTPEPQWTFYRLRWLIAACDDAVKTAFVAPAKDRNNALRTLPSSQWLSLRWQTNPPVTEPESGPRARFFRSQLEAMLRDTLGDRVKTVRVSLARDGEPGPAPPPPGEPGPPGFAFGGAPRVQSKDGEHTPSSAQPDEIKSTFRLRLAPRYGTAVLVPPGVEQAPHSTRLKEIEPEFPVPGIFRIHVQGADDTWLTIRPNQQQSNSLRYWPFIPLVGGVLVVVALSVLTARRILMPLSQLATAAQRMGLEREPVPIKSEGLAEFAAIAEAFNDMQARLKRFVDERTQMLAAMSHDLRTSLTRLKLAVEDMDREDQRQTMSKEVDEMEAMISAVLSFASGDAAGEASRDIDLAALLISTCDDMSDHGKQVVYDGPNHARVRCQPVMMKRALVNVIDNAVKYGDKAHVFLCMTDSAATVGIRDHGTGIPEHRRAEALAPFRRLENSRNRSTGGVGLGLSIARDVVHAHGGTLKLADAPGRGLLVMIRVPLG